MKWAAQYHSQGRRVLAGCSFTVHLQIEYGQLCKLQDIRKTCDSRIKQEISCQAIFKKGMAICVFLTVSLDAHVHIKEQSKNYHKEYIIMRLFSLPILQFYTQYLRSPLRKILHARGSRSRGQSCPWRARVRGGQGGRRGQPSFKLPLESIYRGFACWHISCLHFPCHIVPGKQFQEQLGLQRRAHLFFDITNSRTQSHCRRFIQLGYALAAQYILSIWPVFSCRVLIKKDLSKLALVRLNRCISQGSSETS